MITISEIKKEVDAIVKLLTPIKTVEDCRQLRRYGYQEENIYITVNDEDWNLKDFIFENNNWETTKIEAISFSLDDPEDCGISSLVLKKDGSVIFSVYDNSYDEEYDMLVDTTLETLEEDYQKAIAILDREEY